ncbi:metal-sensing transcriptional repressor [Pseudoramibacter sp. HA2172]|uniref:metal-sensing transcriptional repressor n=1 Tax=Pseudoramibacter faecis TaxID=3108534 RepID=UPI002E778002|nr:metal-sensing transcriptional repressor [Pseudoramibacter sp. HA2172]
MTVENLKIQTIHSDTDESCCVRHKKRNDEEYRCLINRLNRIEGQVRGIKKMVEKDAYCPDILTQSAAVTAAMRSFNKLLLENHIKTCVVEDIKADKEGTIEELIRVLSKLMK